MRVLVATVLALASLLAGCVQPPSSIDDLAPAGTGEAARLACFEHEGVEVCNFEATTTNEQGNEVTIAVNPLDPLNIVAGAKDYTTKYTGGQCVWDGVYVTKDGGKTWKNYNFPGSPWMMLEDPTTFEPSFESTHWCATDPVVAFGPDGTLYYAAMLYQGDPVTASKLGKEQTCAIPGQPIGCTGVNDFAFNRATQFVAVSEDGGESFAYTSMIETGSFPVNFHDRQWIDVANDGTVYVSWTSFLVGGNVFYRSTDRAKTWEGPVFLDGGPLNFVASFFTDDPTVGQMFVAAGKDQTVYVSGWSGEGVYVAKSTDGGQTFAPWKKAAGERDEGMEATYRGGDVGMVAASRTTDSVYVLWVDTRNGDRDVFVAASHDAGETWGEAVRINDDAIGNGKDQFMPTIAVGPEDTVDVVWYDRRNDPDNYLLDVYHAYSTDGGATFSANLRVTPASMDPDHSKHQGGFTFIGDYIDVDVSTAGAHPVWVDTRNGVADVFTAAILRTPGATYTFDGPALGTDHTH